MKTPCDRSLWCGAIVLWLLLGMIGCHAAKKISPPREHLVISTEQSASWIRNFNPLSAAAGARWSALAAIHEPLMIYNRMEGQLVPWLALAADFEDPMHQQLKVTLRPGVQWSDGQAFTARDVAFTFQLLKQFPALDANGIWSFLDRIDVMDAKHLRFHFQRSFAPGLLFILQQPLVAEHAWKDVKDPVSYANENPVATGPYTEVTLFENQVYELGRNPYYWQKDKAAVKALRFPAFASNEQVMLNLLQGNIDLAANFVPAVDRIYVQKDPEHNRYWFPLVGNMVFLYLNTTQVPYDRADVRRAISMAIDRQKIVKVAMFNYSEPAHASGMTQAFARWRLPTDHEGSDWVTFQPEKAETALDQLGLKKDKNGLRRLPNGDVWSLDINVVSGWSDWVRAAQIISKNLRAIGIDARLRTYDFGAWFSQLQRGEFQGAISWSTDTVEPYEFYRWLMSDKTKLPIGTPAASNWHRFGDSDAEASLQKLAGTFDEAEKRRLVDGLQVQFMQKAPAIPLFPNPAWGTAHTRYFQNFPSPTQPYAVLSPNYRPEILQVLTAIRPVTRAAM
ncbi:MAG TPA: ABC transporter substrate-binding protein [Oligoflexus sp.]|uniref:ABC transporter substrate-binding protein n=1 Tax=Oligoflexus sp. TaxID=1971216 RepID=UPI002D221858|nr:ABC transporter substrate-binding protein [Oligoflexus sp.]HYX37155.1 ABC transporter substrate-binding protein [Oligoflexus sp.]